MRTRNRLAWIGLGAVVMCVVASLHGLAGALSFLGVTGWAIAVFLRSTRPALAATLLGIPATQRGAHLASAACEFVLGMILLFCTIGGATMRTDREKRESEKTAEATRQADEKVAAARDADLRAHAQEAIAQTTQAVAEAKHEMERGDVAAAERELVIAQTIVAKYQGLRPPDPNMASLSTLVSEQTEDVTTIDKVTRTLRDGSRDLEDAAEKARNRNYVAADQALERVLRGLSVPPRLAAWLPMNDVNRLRAAAQAKKRAIAWGVTKQEAAIAAAERKQQAANAAAEMYEKLCGDKPERSGWDGEIIGLERHIKETANDPDSIDVEKCTVPVMTEKRCWVSTCNVRGKNAFGALILLRKTYSFSKLGVEEVR